MTVCAVGRPLPPAVGGNDPEAELRVSVERVMRSGVPLEGVGAARARETLVVTSTVEPIINAATTATPTTAHAPRVALLHLRREMVIPSEVSVSILVRLRTSFSTFTSLIFSGPCPTETCARAGAGAPNNPNKGRRLPRGGLQSHPGRLGPRARCARSSCSVWPEARLRSAISAILAFGARGTPSSHRTDSPHGSHIPAGCAIIPVAR